MNIKTGKLLYHLTHIDNLDNIVQNGLLSRNDVLTRGLLREDVANHDIIDKRQSNHLDDYVLFHFHPYTAFATSVKDEKGPKNFVYISIWRDYAREKGFEVIPRHPLNGEFEKYDYDNGFEKIDWEIMEKKQDEIPCFKKHYAKEVKMAECVCKGEIPAQDFAFICCSSQVEKNLKEKYPELKDKIKAQVWFNGN